MIRHDKIARHPRTFKTLIDLSTEGFNQILPSFEEAWESDLDRPGRWAGAATQARRWVQGEAGGHGGHAGVRPDVFPALPHPAPQEPPNASGGTTAARRSGTRSRTTSSPRGCTKKIKALSTTCEGKKHDKKLADEQDPPFLKGSRLWKDTDRAMSPKVSPPSSPEKSPRMVN